MGYQTTILSLLVLIVLKGHRYPKIDILDLAMFSNPIYMKTFQFCFEVGALECRA